MVLFLSFPKENIEKKKNTNHTFYIHILDASEKELIKTLVYYLIGSCPTLEKHITVTRVPLPHANKCVSLPAR